MHFESTTRRTIFYIILLIVSLLIYVTRFNFHTLLQNNSPCFEWRSLSTKYLCQHYQDVNIFIWTYDGSGLMKYIQWIRIRKLGNIILTRLDDNCKIIQQNNYSLTSRHKIFIQIYILSLYTDLPEQSDCLRKINRTLNINPRRVKQIYFTRKSIKAIVLFQQMEQISKFPAEFNAKIDKANYTISRFSTSLISKTTIIINSEDLIHSNLIDCERTLTNFSSLLRLNISKQIIEYDSHHFLEDATWWDRSEIAEHILKGSIPSPSLNLTYFNDFYHLHGDRSFVKYLSDNRRCANEGLFSQMQSETTPNRTSTDIPNRCLSKPYDCTFSDIYSFTDREELYRNPNENPLKCGFAVPTIFDEIRKRYARNHTCEVIIYTLITNCYDPLPIVRGKILPSFCLVALLDTKTVNAQTTFYQQHPEYERIHWDIIDLGINATPFSVPAKSTETFKILGERLFPLAKWIVWLDGKAHIANIGDLIIEARAPVIGATHYDPTRTSASEVLPTIGRLQMREQVYSERYNNSIRDVEFQRSEYERDGFYARSDALRLKIIDIAIFIYRNNHPCITRYLCGWHNEINYYSYRGQLSVYYPAVRLNLTDYFHFLSERYYITAHHLAVCS